jgi:hypothetical protein
VDEMSIEALPSMQSLEGRHVSVALRDGSRIEDCQLVSAHRPGAQTIWLFADGIDVFLPVAAIVACSDATPSALAGPD